MLKDLVSAHGDQLSNITCANKKDGASLLEFAQAGVKDEDVATNTLVKILNQLKSQTEVGVCVCIYQ
jgi:hypothetical protein